MTDTETKNTAPPRATTLQGHPDTSTIFVLGLVGLSGTFVFGGCAWYFGNRLLRKYDAEPGRWGRRGWVQAGRVMGMVGTGLSVVNTGLVLVGLAQ
ncbi:hypothetical protein [Nocardioides sp. CER19]|uniref:hypothetical protein n=1 Tax=Nocardioides sp. CER19 TaxID=3038538 RepID=UPI00244B79D2|nr:hypothetical protein [Nocardioides sp. CER19]MDH2416262.1 hypothetical protein [Nocardioides sp. CER19]